MSKANRPLIFLMTTVVAADASRDAEGRARPSSAKMRRMDGILARRLPQSTPDERWQAVGRALKGMPDISDGTALLKLVEKQARRLNTQLEGNAGRARRVLQYLVQIADADDEITPQELNVIRMVAAAMKVTDALSVREDEWGETQLRVA